MTKGFQDSVLDLKTHSYWSLLFKVALGVKKSCYKAILLNVHPRPKMFLCIAYILYSASVVTSWLESTTCKRLQGDVSNSTKNRQQHQMFWEPRPGGHLDAEQRGAAAHGTVSIACSSPLVERPLRTWPALNKRTFATKSSDFRVSFSKRFISDFDQRPDGQF